MVIDEFAGRIGPRYVIVALVPTAYMVGAVTLLLAAGAPAHRPAWQTALDRVGHLSLIEAGLILAAVVVFSLASHPLQTPLIQIVEGYWIGLPYGAALTNAVTARVRRERHALRRTHNDPALPPEIRAYAQRRLAWLPEEDELLPTTLGNVLRMGEVMAGRRYGLSTLTALPRLFPLISEPVGRQINDLRNQMDASVRLCVVNLLITAVAIPMLLPYDVWLIVPLLTYLFAWACYRAAVAAAKSYCTAMAVAFDLHRLDLWPALSLNRPANLVEELARGPALCDLLRGEELAPNQYRQFRYQVPNRSSLRDAGGG